MGIVAYNYVVNDVIIDKVLKSDSNAVFNSQENENNLEEYYFEKNEVIFWTGMKAWSPMYELLKILDKSENNILSEIGNSKYYLEETEIYDRMYLYYSFVVKEIWNELKNISVGDIEMAIDNPIIIEIISNISGYGNDRIIRKQHIVMEFFEFYKAFYEANLREKGIIIGYS